MGGAVHLPEVDKYAHVNSFVHQWDGRIRIVSLAVLIVAIALLTRIDAALAALGFAFTLVLASRIPVGFVFRRMRWVLIFVGVLFAALVLTVPGVPVMQLSPVILSREGVELGGLVALRAVSIALLVVPMFGTSAFHTSLKALGELGMPPKVVQLVSFTYRYLFLFAEEGGRILVAARSRGWTARKSPAHVSMAGNMVGMLLVRSFERAERVYNAMLSRGYHGRVVLEGEFAAQPRDWLKGALVIGAAVGLHFIGRV